MGSLSFITTSWILALVFKLKTRLKTYGYDLEIFKDVDIYLGDEIARGNEGIVSRCQLEFQAMLIECAAKQLLNCNSEESVMLSLEELFLNCRGYCNLVATTARVFGVAVSSKPIGSSYVDVPHIIILTELGEMDLLKLYSTRPVDQLVTCRLFSDLAASIQRLHDKKILHRDIKPENILVITAPDSNNALKKIDHRVIDLGMAIMLPSQSITSDLVFGTTGYHAPEVVNEERYGLSSDIYSLGVTFVILLHSHEMLKNNEFKKLLTSLHSNKLRGINGTELYENIILPSMKASRCPLPDDTLKDIICEMLMKRDNRRIQLSDIQRRLFVYSEEQRQIKMNSGDSLMIENCKSSQTSVQKEKKEEVVVVDIPFKKKKKNKNIPTVSRFKKTRSTIKFKRGSKYMKNTIRKRISKRIRNYLNIDRESTIIKVPVVEEDEEEVKEVEVVKEELKKRLSIRNRIVPLRFRE